VSAGECDRVAAKLLDDGRALASEQPNVVGRDLGEPDMVA
jgi:hypothetical protein